MNEARVSRLIVADSMPVMHDAVNEVQRRGPADILRFPNIVKTLAGNGSKALQRCLIDQISLIRELHGISEVAVVADDLTDYNGTVGHIGRSLNGKWRFELVIPDLGASEFAPGIAKTWGECTVTCVDYRRPFATARDALRTPNHYEITIPGAAKCFLEEGPLTAQIFPWLYERGLLVKVFQHEDCGAYGPELHADSPVELIQHRKDVARFATLSETHGVRFAGGGLIELSGAIRRF